ncbi:MAG: type I restriction enzyme HsdR N-terminal domain-containing protein, partial [Chitinophagaceae bacterium]|nr:type I restriction enzyme HsdR N-terminal domain-containing protein [Chitinophagaceae bacterium]
MIKIDYPDHPFRIKNDNNKELIFDEIRKTWLLLTPEEWVRQNFVHYLLKVKKYPSALVALEKKIMVGEMIKRFDILIYNNDHRPWLMVECKSMDVALKEEVLNQVLRYNIAMPVNYLVITNGTSCMAFKKENRQLIP